MKDTPASATNDTEKLEIVLPFEPGNVRISPIWASYTASPWLRLLKRPAVRPLEYPITMIEGDTFNYSQMIHLTHENKVESTLNLYICLRATETRILTETAVVAIAGRFFFFDPTESEDVKLYEYSLDPSVLESLSGSGSVSGQPESGG